MRRLLSLLLLLPGPALAGGLPPAFESGANSESTAYSAPQNMQQNQSSSTSIGGNNYSNVYMTEFGKTSTFDFSEKGVRCESPRLSIGTWADPGNQYYSRGIRYQDEHDIRGGIALSIPLGAERETCKAMAKKFEERVSFDTARGIAKNCAALTKAGTQWTPELLGALPDLKVCAQIAGVIPLVEPQEESTPQQERVLGPRERAQ